MAERRRLPVIQSPPPKSDGGGDADDPNAIDARPPWHWVGFGAVAIFAAWLPLAYAAQTLGERLVHRRFAGASESEMVERMMAMTTEERLVLFAPMAALHVLALALSAAAGGYLVGRYGSGTTLREPAMAGGVVALMAITLSAGRGGVGSAVLTGAVILVIAVGGAALGGRKGLAKKDRGAPIVPSA